MGAWGAGIFENDDACDFALDVAESSSLSKIEAIFDNILGRGSEYLEAPEASEGLAAADIIARLGGKYGQRDAYTSKIDAWVKQMKLTPSIALMEKARQTVSRVGTEPSELLELWSEGDDSLEFQKTLAELSDRLG